MANPKIKGKKSSSSGKKINFSDIIENIEDAILVLNNDSTVFYLNQNACKLFGRTAEEIYSSGIEGLFDTENPYNFFFTRKNKSIKKFTKELYIIKKDGEKIPISASCFILKDEKNNEIINIIIKDLSVKKKFETKYKKYELTLSSIFRSAPIGIGVEINRVIKDVNDEFCNIFGYTKEELLEKDSEILYPDISNYNDLGKFKSAQLKRHNKITCETQMKRKDGKIIDVLISTTPINDSNKNEGNTFSVIDITDRNRMTKQLTDSELKYRNLFNNSGTSILIIDKDGIYRLVNDRATIELGKPREEIEGKSMFDFLTPETAKKYYKINKELIKKGGHREYEDTFFINNKTKTYYIVDRVLQDSDGRNYAIQSSAIDITEQKIAEEKTQLLAHTTKSIEEIVTITDLEDRITYVNNAFCDIYGYDYNEIIGQHISILNSPNNPPDLLKNILKHSHKDKWKGELLNVTKDGKEFSIYLHTSKIINKEGKVIGLAGVSEDITKKKQFELKLKKSEEKYHAIFEATGTATMLVNEDTTIDMINKECERITGYSAKELIGTKWTNYVEQSSLQEMINYHYIRRQYSESAPKNYEVKLIHKNGSIHDAILDIGMIPGTKQSIVSILDITERKQAEMHLRLSEKRLEEAQSRSHIGSWELDINNNTSFWSKEMFRLFDVNPNKGVPDFQNFIKLIHSEDRDRINSSFKNAIEEKKSYKDIYRIILPNGKIRWIEGQGEPFFDKNNNFIKLVGTSQDITERFLFEEKLEKEKQQHATLISNLPGFVYRCLNNKDWTMSFVSEGFRKITGYATEDIIGNAKITFNDIILPKYRKYIWEKWQKLLKDRIKFEDEYEIRTAFGEVKWVWERGNGVYDENGNVLYLEGYIEDITERKKSEEEKRKSEFKFKGLFMSLSEGFYISEVLFDKKGNPYDYIYTEINPEFEKIAGLKRDQIIGKRYSELVTVDTSNWLENYFKVARTGIPSMFEFYSKEYNAHFETYSYQSLENQICVFVRNITERKKTEEALRDSEQKFRNLIETMPEGFYRSTPEGYFLDVNPALVKMLGYESKEELMKVYIPDELYFSRDERIEGINYNMDFVPDSEIYRLKKKDGIEIWVEDHSRYITNNSGKTIYHEGIMHDITESLRAQRAIIEAKEKAEEANRLKSSFLANMSHEIRTPLNGILGFSQILKNELKGTPLKKYADVIEKSGSRLLETLDLILSFSKLEAEKEDVHYSNIKIKNVIDEVIKSFEATATNKNLYIKSVIEEENLVTKTDERFIRQILNNLINNAIKYTNHGGITVSLSKKDKDIIIKVIDTGIGIAKNKHKLIFEEFRQESEGHGRSFEGTGLGLAITKRFIELMKGTIEVESDSGLGSTFIVKIPHSKAKQTITIKLKEEDTDTISLPQPKEKDKLSVLIVENDDMNLDYTVALLRDYYNTDSAFDGIEALEKVKTKSYDIILMDINLGKGIDGIQTTKEIRKLPGYEKTPIVALTAFVLPGDREEFISGGCTHYLGKPFSKIQILELLNNICKSTPV